MSLYHQEKEKKVEVEEGAKVKDMLKWKLQEKSTGLQEEVGVEVGEEVKVEEEVDVEEDVEMEVEAELEGD